jgi:hypothetical protein
VLLTRDERARIVAGEQTVVFRRWRRPTVRAGGTLRTASGVVAIDAIDTVDAAALTASDAQAGGFASRAALLAALATRAGEIYRITLHHAGADPRIALRARDALSPDELDDLQRRLARLDRTGAWTRRVLRLIADHPGRRAADLAAQFGQETLVFKRNVRKLKELGLTESLEIGYRLAPRGQRVLDALPDAPV